MISDESTSGNKRAAMQIEIRDRGVYTLPDGSEVIAHRAGDKRGFFRLYDPVAWKFGGEAMYETDETGVITSLGRPTPWCLADLEDAGLTAPSRYGRA